MSFTCPNGHPSEADDYCDVCGSPIDKDKQGYAAGPAPAGTSPAAPAGSSLDLDPAAEPAAEAAAAGSTKGAALECPNCTVENPEGAFFCEACGYDFTTGAMPRDAAGGAGGAGGAGAGAAGAAAPAEPATSSGPGVSATSPASGDGASGAPAFEWLAEVWIDPDWYGTQEVDDPCPSPGLPVIVPLHGRSCLLGRVSASRNTHPEIDLSSDPGVSRRHAQLTSDGTRWFVEDLRSSNGTFVGPASGPLPDDPIAVGPKTELGDDDRLYVGAWTRVVVRKATPDEVDAYA